MVGRYEFLVEKNNPVGSGVVLGRDEHRVGGDLNAEVAQARAHLGLIEDRRRGAGTRAALLAATCAAVQRRLVRVVLRGAAVTAEHHGPGEIRCEPHHGERDLSEQDSILGRHRVEVEDRGRDGGDHVTQPTPDVGAERGSERFGRRKRRRGEPGRLCQGEGGREGVLGGMESRFSPCHRGGPGQSTRRRVDGVRRGPFAHVVVG